MPTDTADIRVHSEDPSASYGLEPLTRAGLLFVAGQAAMVQCVWENGVLWFSHEFMPFVALNQAPLVVVTGRGHATGPGFPWMKG